MSRILASTPLDQHMTLLELDDDHWICPKCGRRNDSVRDSHKCRECPYIPRSRSAPEAKHSCHEAMAMSRGFTPRVDRGLTQYRVLGAYLHTVCARNLHGADLYHESFLGRRVLTEAFTFEYAHPR